MTAAKPAMQSERRTRLRNRPQLLLGMTVTWNAIEAGVAVTAGFAAGSVALVGFGLDSIVEVFAATVAIWQLHGAREDRERKALRLIGLSFFADAAYVFAESLRDLLMRSRAAESTVGIALAAASLAVMPTLALTKRRLAERLGSATLRAEAA